MIDVVYPWSSPVNKDTSSIGIRIQNIVILCYMCIFIFESIVPLIIAQIIFSGIFCAWCTGQIWTCLGYYYLILLCTEQSKYDISKMGIFRIFCIHGFINSNVINVGTIDRPVWLYSYPRDILSQPLKFKYYIQNLQSILKLKTSKF